MAAGGPLIAGVRATPGLIPTPNSEPTGYLTGAPVLTRFFGATVMTASQQIVEGAANNRVVILLAPIIGFTVFIGAAGVTPGTGLALPPGQPYEALLPGLQELHACTDAPTPLRVQVQVASVLFAERQRRVG